MNIVKCKRCNSLVEINGIPVLTRVGKKAFYLCWWCQYMLELFLGGRALDFTDTTIKEKRDMGIIS